MHLHAALGALVSVSLVAQATRVAAPLDFEVASIRPHARGDSRSSSTELSPGGRFTAINVTVRKMIRNAFDVEDFQISGAPGWIDSASYDIQATTGGVKTTTDDISPLLLSLLQERFHLRFQRIRTKLTEWALEVAKKGPKLKPNTDGGETFANTNSRAGIVTLKANKISMADFAWSLRRQLGRPVIDKTGLAGEFDLDLTWSSEQAAERDEPSVFTALRQLGLRLVAMKGWVDIILIDEVEKPSEN
jgi:uncharacterized protein (TIGR03435 family)